MNTSGLWGCSDLTATPIGTPSQLAKAPSEYATAAGPSSVAGLVMRRATRATQLALSGCWVSYPFNLQSLSFAGVVAGVGVFDCKWPLGVDLDHHLAAP